MCWPTFVIALTEKSLVRLSSVISRNSRLFGFGFVLSAALLMFSGCDGGRAHYPVDGTIKFKKDDSVAQFGTIEFRSESEPIVTARATIQKDGTFSLMSDKRNGAVGGWHTVVILQPVSRFHSGVVHNHGLEAARKYFDHRTTDLRVEVKADAEDDAYDLSIDNWVK